MKSDNPRTGDKHFNVPDRFIIVPGLGDVQNHEFWKQGRLQTVSEGLRTLVLTCFELVILKNGAKFCPCKAVRTCFEPVILKNGAKFCSCKAVRTCFEPVILKIFKKKIIPEVDFYMFFVQNFALISFF